MIERSELERIRKYRNLSLYQTEKEYLLTAFLFSLSLNSDKFVFKGGSCLRLIHGYARFSEDLDFNTELNVKEIKRIVDNSLVFFKDIAIDYDIINDEAFRNSFTMKIRFKGPLYMGREDSTNTISVDVGKRKTSLAEINQIQKIYADIPAFFIKSMSKKEILAEKLDGICMIFIIY